MSENKNLEVDFEDNKIEDINQLHFPDRQLQNIIKRVHNSLKNGKHLILVGPPGTGKSKLAKIICNSYRKSKNKWKMSTATSDWTTFDTIGGYRMTPDNGLEFKPGIFLDCFKDKSKTKKSQDIYSSDLPDEGEIYDFLDTNLNKDDYSKKLKQLYSILYYLRKQKKDGEDYDGTAALKKTMNKEDDVKTEPYFAITRSGWNSLNDFMDIYNQKENEGALFNLDRKEYRKYLEEGTINPELKEVFQDEGLNIEDDAKLSEVDGTWYISQNDNKEYKIEVGEEELSIQYKEILTTIDEHFDLAPNDKKLFKILLENENSKETKDLISREVNTPQNIWLIIDEINRADIDKAFGSLFSALTGDDIELPYKVENDDNIEVIANPTKNIEEYDLDSKYVIPEDWRIIATMNTFDKSSLYTMSYAFMRRFAFIKVGIPEEIKMKNENLTEEKMSKIKDLVKKYKKCWNNEVENKDDDINDDLIEDIANIWFYINKIRRIGPAIIKDIFMYLRDSEDDYEGALIQFVYPQFEGVSKKDHEYFIRQISGEYKKGKIKADTLIQFVNDFFRLDITIKEEQE